MPTGAIDRRHLRRVLARTGLLQIDSISVLVRAHYLPLFSRLGAYPRDLIDDAALGRRRLLFEYWAHEASLLPLELQPSLRWRMARAQRFQGIWAGLARFARERSAYIDWVHAEVAARGPLIASDLDGSPRQGSWWGWGDAKAALEFLFWAGRLAVATRRAFERVYDLPERVLPAAILAAPTPTEAEAHRNLLRIAARALGIATASDLRDYFRMSPADVKARLPELVEAGELVPAVVEGWTHPAYLHAQARSPRRVAGRALLAPFDPLMWERSRVERLFGFRYRVEIYTPAERRQHGYYVLPFLLGERLVARVDLKSDRAEGALRVLAASPEPAAPEEAASALAQSLREMAAWLGLGRVEVSAPGPFADRLTVALGQGSG